MSGSDGEIMREPCSVCLNSPMLKPIYQCFNGHVLCVSCEGRLSVCPSCRLKLSKSKKIRNLVVEQNQPPLIKCENEGCADEFATDEDRKAHSQNDCHYGTHKLCQIVGIDRSCNKEFKPSEADSALTHILKDHGNNAMKFYPGFWDSRVHPGSWAQGLGGPKFHCFKYSGVLFIMKSGTCVFGNMRTVVPFVFASASKYPLLHLQIKMWIGTRRTISTIQDFQKKPDVRCVHSVGPTIPVIGYNPEKSYPGIVEAGSSGNSCFMQASPREFA